jgi:hypothetical protein
VVIIPDLEVIAPDLEEDIIPDLGDIIPDLGDIIPDLGGIIPDLVMDMDTIIDTETGNTHRMLPQTLERSF